MGSWFSATAANFSMCNEIVGKLVVGQFVVVNDAEASSKSLEWTLENWKIIVACVGDDIKIICRLLEVCQFDFATKSLQRRNYFQTKGLKRDVIKKKFAQILLKSMLATQEDLNFFQKLAKFGSLEIKSTKNKEQFEEAFFKTIKLHSQKQPELPKKDGPILANNFKKQQTVNFVIEYTDLTVGEEIGSGGFANVYKAKWAGLNVALKKVRADLPLDVVETFEDEARTMAALNHPNIVLLVAVAVDPLCLVMELLDTSLYHKLRQMPFSWPQTMSIALDVARGMTYLHNQGLIHGDLKSLNVLMDKHLVAKVSDFGLSRFKNLAFSTTTSKSSELKAEGFTLVYAAPELLQKQILSTQTDVYAFSIILWELVTRELPYKLISPNEVMSKVMHANLRPEIPEKLNPKYRTIMTACWAGDKTKRPHFIDVIEGLEDLQTEK